MNVDKKIITELLNLGPMQVQKVLGIMADGVAIKLYSPAIKDLYLVFDTHPTSRTFHCQKTQPPGLKTTLPLTLAIKKYLLNRAVRFYRVNSESSLIKMAPENLDPCLMFSFEPPQATIFVSAAPKASLKPGHLKYDDGLVNCNEIAVEIGQNIEAGALYDSKFRHRLRELVYGDKVRVLKARLKKLTKLLENLMADAKKCQKNLGLEAVAELLKTHMHLVKRGDTEVTVTDYAVHPPQTKRIELAPGSVQAMLAGMYNKVKRAKRGLINLAPRLDETRREIEAVKAELLLVTDVGVQGVDVDLSTKSIVVPVKLKKNQENRRPYRSYVSSDNLPILVAKSAADGDALTLRHARGNEWWLHVKDATGAHVVVKCVDDLPPNTLLEAATLAAFYSKAKNEASVPVQYTRVKHVRKTSGLAAGQVLVAQAKTILIRIDEGRLSALKSQVTT
jgi:predicted ribosome quality control (RQC) complex YloA/Tae2 family protein